MYHAAASKKTRDSAPMAATPVIRPMPGMEEAAPAPAPEPVVSLRKWPSISFCSSSGERSLFFSRSWSTYFRMTPDCTDTPRSRLPSRILVKRSVLSGSMS